MVSQSNWLDSFLFWDLLIVTILVAADWYIGEGARKKHKDIVEHLWLVIETTSFSGFVSKDAKMVHDWIKKFFGEDWHSIRFILTSISVSIVITTVILLAGLAIQENTNDQEFVHTIGRFIVQNAVLDWASLAATYAFLAIMSASVSIRALSLTILLDWAAAIGFWVIVVLGALIITILETFPDNIIDPLLNLDIMGLIKYLSSMFIIVHDPIDAFTIAVMVIGITSALPSLVHSGIALVFLFSKTFRPILRPVISKLLYAFYDSKKGVLTQLSIGIGVSAKLLQSYLKAYGA